MAPGAPSLQLCIFDSTRGQQEGHELDKILFFHPLDLHLQSQLSVIGLSEGLITFSRIFSPSAPCEFMEAEKHFHIFYECEPDIWMILIIEKNNEGEMLARENAYRNILKQMYSIFHLFYGSLTTLLRNNPMADVVRNCLYCFVPDFVGEVFLGKNLWLPTISDSLAENGTIQVLSLRSEILLEAKSLVGILESWFGGDTVRHSLIFFHKFIVSTTLPPDDTAAIFSYANLRLIPAAISRSYAQGAKRSHSRSSMLNTVVSTFVSDAKRNAFSGDTYVADGINSTEQRVNASRPLKQDAWWQDSEGFLATNAWGEANETCALPTIIVQGARMQLCIYQHRALTLLMLIPVSAGHEAMPLLRKHILEKAADRIQMFEEKLTSEWGGNNSLHVPGYRYLNQDINRKVIKASPPGKVLTLSKESLAALDRVRGQLDLDKNRLERDFEGDSELCVRTKNNAWVCARTKTGHELYVVLEKASDTLLLASDAIEKFNKRHCDGKFTSD